METDLVTFIQGTNPQTIIIIKYCITITETKIGK